MPLRITANVSFDSFSWLSRFLLSVQCRMLAPEDMEKEPERWQEQRHTNNSANQQRQECGRWTGSIAYCHSNRDQVRKLRQAPGSKNEGRYGKRQNTSQAIAPQEQRGGGSQSDQRSRTAEGKSVIERAVPQKRSLERCQDEGNDIQCQRYCARDHGTAPERFHEFSIIAVLSLSC